MDREPIGLEIFVGDELTATDGLGPPLPPVDILGERPSLYGL